MTADRAMEAARFLIDAYAKRRPQKGAEPYALIVALAYVQQREAIIEECAKVADGAVEYQTLEWNGTPASKAIASAIRALAARKETPNE